MNNGGTPVKLGRWQVGICDCEGTMKIDCGRLSRALDADLPPLHHQLCRGDLASFERMIGQADGVLVACTQEAPLFREVADDARFAGRLAFVNIRERAGWGEAGASALPKIAALLADAAAEIRPAEVRSIESDGLCLVYGSGPAAVEVAQALSARLSVILLLDQADDDVILPPTLDFAVYCGRITGITGALGQFDVTVAGHAAMLPSSRRSPAFGRPHDGVQTRCSIILDLSGGPGLFRPAAAPDGYFRADPGSPLAVMRAVFDASDMAGSFEKPIYVDYDPAICAHSRARQVGCRNCLDACPIGAIAPAGDGIAVDSAVCGGCGGCAAHCPTGALSYRLPDRAGLVHRIQTLARTFRSAGGSRPVLLLHSEGHGFDIINVIARRGRGLPAHVIPLGLHAVTSIGHDALASAFAVGFERVVILADPRSPDAAAALDAEIALTTTILAGFGFAAPGRIVTLAAEDPDTVDHALHALEPLGPCAEAAILPVGGKREVARIALKALADAAPRPPGIVPLPPGAPYGRIRIETGGCTLCLACVSSCPADALSDDPDRPTVRLTEAACVQCGLCARICPERVITLEPRLTLGPEAMQPVVLHQEEPFACIECGKPFAAKSTIDRITRQLAGHWMFQSQDRIAMLQMCDDCRVRVRLAKDAHPMAAGDRPRPRTTDDYKQADASGQSIEDFLKDD
ncbi:MAG: 4Fe-4S ferredoxin [Rhodospirillaceae bacterium]|nr:4Fe-4S ferredoxin [Rhodospirillaceae bacterium]